MKPVVLPMLHLLCGSQSRNWLCRNVSAVAATDAQHTLVFVRENLHEIRNDMLPVVENPLPTAASCEFNMARNQLAHLLDVIRLNDGFKIDRFKVAPFLGEVASFIKDIRDAATHARRKIS